MDINEGISKGLRDNRSDCNGWSCTQEEQKFPERAKLMKESGVESQGDSSMASTSGQADLPHAREKWARKTDFLLSVAGGFIGLGNIWRFPYLCYKNGGGAFLIPYCIFMILGGIPIFFLEVALGQYTSEGGITSWSIAPIGKGIGYASMVIVSLLNIYYIVILAWAIFYLFQSFTLGKLPWAKCGQYWNTECCVETFTKLANQTNSTTTTSQPDSTTVLTMATTAAPSYIYNETFCNGTKTTPETEFWENRVLGLSSGLEDIGNIRWELALCLLAAWVICYFCIWKGVKSTGKVVYFTATFPFLMLMVLLIRGVTLPGAIVGIKFYLTPDIAKLSEPQVWLDAGTQIFFSYAICLGAMISLGSYNKYHNNCYKDCIALSLVNSGTSFISGFAIFSVLGFMAEEQGISVKDVAESGPGLAFIAYPKAVTLMPGSTVWAVLFFFMLILLGLDSQFVEVEGFVTSFVDLFPQHIRRGNRREIFIAIVCFISYLIGLSMVTNGGMYVFQLFDYYAASGVCLLWVAFFEASCIAWVYGAEKMWTKITNMIGYRPLPVIKYCWMFLTPVLTTGTFLYSLVKFKPLVYNKVYIYPAWGEGIGWILALSSMLVIPGYALFKMMVTPGTLYERWTYLTTPVLSKTHPECQEYNLKEKLNTDEKFDYNKVTEATQSESSIKKRVNGSASLPPPSYDSVANQEDSFALKNENSLSNDTSL